MKRAAVIGGILVVLGVSASMAIKNPVPNKPRNLAVTDVTSTSIKLMWGPSPPGPYKVVANTASSVTVTWGAAKDTRKPITYTVRRNGAVVSTGQKLPSRKFSVTPTTKSFKICVQAFNALHQSSVNVCGSIFRSATHKHTL